MAPSFVFAVEGFSLADAFSLGVLTITTVGFGSLHPVTPAGEVLAAVLILIRRVCDMLVHQ